MTRPRVKTCETCGQTFRRPSQGRTDARWAAQRFCSSRCAGAAWAAASRARPLRGCDVAGCPRPHFGRGYCRAHFYRDEKYGSPHGRRTEKSRKERFLEKVVKPDDADACWEWTGARNAVNGRPVASNSTGSGGVLAARAAYEIFVGPVPPDHHVHHDCVNDQCVNSQHLQALTPEEHTAWHAERRGDVCARGHEDWYMRPGGGRFCRACQRGRRAS